MTAAFIIDLLTIAAIFTFGWIVVKAAWDGWDWVETLAYSFPLGCGLITWCLFMVSWIGMSYTPATLIMFYVFLLGFAAVVLFTSEKENDKKYASCSR